MVDHETPEEVAEFDELSFYLFGWNKKKDGENGGDMDTKSMLDYRGFLLERTTPSVSGATSHQATSSSNSDAGGLLGASADDSGAQGTFSVHFDLNELVDPSLYAARSELFQKLISFFPADMKEPCTSLVDLLVL